MRSKKKTVEQKKQKQPEIREVSPVDGYGCLWRKRFLEKICFSLEWKSEGVMDDDSGDSEGDEGEQHWLRQGQNNYDINVSVTIAITVELVSAAASWL